MASNWKNIHAEVMSTTGALAKASPELIRAFGGLAAVATKDGALSKKTKELMAVSISICLRCEGCIAYHTTSAIKAGATREEFIETIDLAVEMGGGPSTVYGAKALQSL